MLRPADVIWSKVPVIDIFGSGGGVCASAGHTGVARTTNKSTAMTRPLLITALLKWWRDITKHLQCDQGSERCRGHGLELIQGTASIIKPSCRNALLFGARFRGFAGGSFGSRISALGTSSSMLVGQMNPALGPASVCRSRRW